MFFESLDDKRGLLSNSFLGFSIKAATQQYSDVTYIGDQQFIPEVATTKHAFAFHNDMQQIKLGATYLGQHKINSEENIQHCVTIRSEGHSAYIVPCAPSKMLACGITSKKYRGGVNVPAKKAAVRIIAHKEEVTHG